MTVMPEAVGYRMREKESERESSRRGNEVASGRKNALLSACIAREIKAPRVLLMRGYLGR